jgi:predicted nucleotidyltransferase
MRLNCREIEAIKETAREIFGDNATISLFGSRTDNNKKGGDIDLFIQCDLQISGAELYQLKIKFLVQLKKIIGDQKIDVLINRGQLSRNILESVDKERVQLWP